MPDGKLPLIGRDRVMLDKFAKLVQREVSRHYEYSRLREDPRGSHFEVRLVDGRIARVTVELDRVEQPDG